MTYPSRRKPIADIADEVAARIEADVPGRPLFAVTHSMGGIVLRHLADRFPWSGCVLLAPPNGGSRAAELASRIPPLRWFFGPSLLELAEPPGWPPPPDSSLVIAGTRGVSIASPPSWFFGLAGLFANDERHDGTVAVDETEHDDLADHVEIRAGHSTIMSNREVITTVVHWLNDQRRAGGQ